MNNLLTMEEHFAKAIDANPHDMDTRRAYSDWLEEQGREEEAAAWWEVRDRVPHNGLPLDGWYPEESNKVWGEKHPYALIPRKIFDLLSTDVKDTYSPFLNLSALVREMLKQQA